ncbi:bifunctional adenosylcobinamide kinase/adenosylcobinamide-phosphate guanylyltransferase [Solimonas marina]|uniref:Bifunctional adenosylcobalamin biosynthesis protein n=1 Tax=Solimonas marina TaxID=2714601 RepID=A0A970B4Y4_9GAMM|nr:bifunctional adenosylcobinamide kinase/adenosylcobinamide-phosphate guanylyltransferase [Solimonas marina]NKF21005.1 bifunctional adenosylcobinamide kinase/adenosylcobinamide-phosphate guanylyltransferase [Solimonas marina]
MSATTLILGGVRSGKSRFAEQQAIAAHGDAVTYIATAREMSGDAEFAARIAAHRTRRPAAWRSVEAPVALATALRVHADHGRALIVDCLTLWLTNLLCADDETLLARERDALLATLPQLPGTVLLVGNETGLGVVPLGALTRRYVDEAGVLHQQLAALSSRVIFTVAGLPMVLKGAL